MVIDTEKKLSEINEITMLLNSNMEDTKLASFESKAALLDGVQELTRLNEDIMQDLNKFERQLITRVQKLETNLQQMMKETSSNTNFNLKSEYNDLRQKLYSNLQVTKDLISLVQKEQVENFQKIFDKHEESLKAQKDMMLYQYEKIEYGFDGAEKNYKKLSYLLTEIRNTVTIENEKSMKSNLEQHNKLKKSNRIWFIFLFIFIFIGYFI